MESSLETKKAKVSKTFRLDSDVLTWLEKRGQEEGLGYQTFLNWFLRKSMNSNKSLEQRVKELEAALDASSDKNKKRKKKKK